MQPIKYFVRSDHAHLVVRDEDDRLAKEAERQVVVVAELGGDGEHQDDLRHEGQQADADVLLVHGEVQHVEVGGEVVPDVPPGYVVQVGLVQEVAAEAAVEERREGAERDGSADGEPDPRPVDLDAEIARLKPVKVSINLVNTTH